METLTPIEKEILKLNKQHLTQIKIAAILGKGESTIIKYYKSIKQKGYKLWNKFDKKPITLNITKKEKEIYNFYFYEMQDYSRISQIKSLPYKEVQRLVNNYRIKMQIKKNPKMKNELLRFIKN